MPNGPVISVTQILTITPELQQLAAVADSEGHRHINTLVSEFISGVNRFEQPGEALFGCFIHNKLAAVAGLNIDPYQPRSDIGRLRRLYVVSQHRRSGIASALVNHIEVVAAGHFKQLRLYTPNPQADAFYRRLGYEPQSQYKVSHRKLLPQLPTKATHP